MGFVAFKLLGLLASLACLAPSVGCVSMSSCVEPGPVIEESKTIEIEDAEVLVAEIQLALGKLHIEGGGKTAVKADFTYNVEDLRPEVAYEMSGTTGRLSILTPSQEGITINGKVKNEWKIVMVDGVHTAIDIELGAGSTDLQLAGLSITDLSVEQGVGELALDLTGPWKESADIRIDGGVGDATIYVPEDVGVRVRCKMGLGSVDVEGLVKKHDHFMNDQYGRSDITIDVRIEGGIGRIRVRPSSTRDSAEV
jgi:hypothetical protein